MRQYFSSKVQGLELEFVGDLGEATAKYNGKEIGTAGLYDISTYEVRMKGERESYFSEGNIKDIFMEQAENYVLRNKELFKEVVASGKLNRAAAAELLLTADMITISELSPYFEEDKKAAIKLDETTAEFLINKSPELKQAFEDKGYDNWKSFFENNRGEAYIEADDLSNIGITVVINDNKEYPIPLSLTEQNALKDKFNEECKRRNKEYMEDRDGDHIPDRIDNTFNPEGFRDAYKYPDDEYRIALVSSDEYNELKSKGFECQKAKSVHEDGRIPIRFKVKEKDNFERIILSMGGKNGGIHI